MLTRTKVRANPETRRLLELALEARGFRTIGSKSKIYQAYELVVGDKVFTYFLGRDGELRMSRTAKLSDSISLKGLDAYHRLLDEGRELREKL